MFRDCRLHDGLRGVKHPAKPLQAHPRHSLCKEQHMRNGRRRALFTIGPSWTQREYNTIAEMG